MKFIRQTVLLLLLAVISAGYAQDAYVYMTVHNLGCRQANSTYAGFLPNYGFAEGDLVQVILAGPNGVIDPPLANGNPGGDDQLAVNPGLPFAMNPVSFTQYPNTFYSPEAILLESTGNGPEPALHPGLKFYVRAWNGVSPGMSTRYFNSAQLTQDYPVGLESCSVDSAVRAIRPVLSFPALITYAVVFDAGHNFSAALSAPHVIIYFDSTQTMIFWNRVSLTASYRIESSLDNAVWDTVATIPDTAFVIPDIQGPNVHQLFRVFAIQ